MPKDVLLKIFNDLFTYFSKYEVVSEAELTLKIRECVNSLLDANKEVLEENLGGNLEDLIFKSITTREEKISVFSPDMHVKINYQGEIFYCMPTHRYMSEDLEKAFLRLAKIKSPQNALEKVVKDFMEKCEYRISFVKKDEQHIEAMAEKEDKILCLYILSSIKLVPYFIREKFSLLSASERECKRKVIIVPTERTPMPFISFFREQDVGNMEIWVANVEKNTINPFIGKPEDEAIEKNFENPEQTRKAIGIWMKRMPWDWVDL